MYEPPFPPAKKDILLYSAQGIKGDIWMATPYGITRYNEKKNTWTHYSITRVSGKDIIPQIGIVKKGKGCKVSSTRENSENILDSMIQNAEAEYLYREKALQVADIILDKSCTIDSKNLDCDAAFKGDFEHYVHVTIYADRRSVSRTARVSGAEDGIFAVYLHVDSLTLEGAGGDMFNFAPEGKHVLAKGNFIDLPPKGTNYLFENHRYRLQVEVVDHKTSPVAFVGNYSGKVFDYVKFRIKLFKILESMGN